MTHNFQQIVNDPIRIRGILNNCSFGGTYERWVKRKKFISDAIKQSGTFLDIGCGNGFLIRCLQEWSNFELIPFGVDIDKNYILKAKEMFPENANNFSVLDARNLVKLRQVGLPDKYDSVYFSNIWTEGVANISKTMIQELLEHVNPGGRLIIGFYDEDSENNLRMLNLTEASGVKWSGSKKNPSGTNLVAWVDQGSS